MKLENLVCSYEQSKRLVKLGLMPVAPLRHVGDNKVGLLNIEAKVYCCDGKIFNWDKDTHLPAFTLSEIFKIIKHQYDTYQPSQWLQDKYKDTNTTDILDIEPATDILIDLLETGQLTIAVANERLIDAENSIVTK